ncbi:type IX secretion system ring protein PorN/GldN [Mucilaginibacter sp. KACC 22063]|uniref:type IX secretion system ring protein PorN/GldN n=1 Tax=Mucilaginibacter sp. KACC 22063 TaxID=3025666 RepID=UPI00236641AE|nr:gliding motility protein GldN [Mucilaginibacter sp. KACC 22063]WDF56237.1 gliding motility protein GldN [Mucilaginibacter sp. KACC 22063]
MKKIIVVVFCLLAVSSSFAQKKKRTTTKRRTPAKKTAPASVQPQNVAAQSTTMSTQPMADTSKKAAMKPFERPLDGYFKKTNIINARVAPMANLRESDVMFEKRVWREVDTREKMNRYMSSPKAALITILVDAIANGELTAYDPTPTKDDINGDAFGHPLTPGQAKARLADSVVIDKIDKNTGEKVGSALQAGEFNPDSVVKFRIKEDWIFDKQRSVFEPRIIGIAPMMKPKVGGADADYIPIFWVYFPEARQVLATKEVVNRNNDATGLSYDDVFMKRLFSSYIVKVSNEKDERIKDYAQGIDKLYESERVKKSLMDWELNLWQY